MNVLEALKHRKTTDYVSPRNEGEEVILCGFVRNIRIVSKKLKFVILEDFKGDVQLIFKDDSTPELILKRVDELTLQSVICVKGVIHKTSLTKRSIEVIVRDLEVLSKSKPQLPIDISGSTNISLSKRLNWRFLDLRSKRKHLIFTLLSEFERYSREFFYKNDFIEIHSPKLMGAASESGAEVFRVEYFGRKAYLAQSPQFYKQMAMCAGFERVFEIAPVFRANPSFTSRHDTEFTSLDIEMSYISSVEDVMSFEEKWIAYVLKKLKEKWGDIIQEEFGIRIKVPSLPFPRIKMKDAYEILKNMNVSVQEGDDLGTLGEKALSKYVKEELKHDFVFIVEFPWKVRPFYHMRPEGNKTITSSFDLLWNGLEITTGAQREHRYDVLVEQAREKGLNINNLKFYLDFFKYGCPPHGGFGLSPTRFIMCLLKLENVKEATFLPRDPKRLFP